MTGPTGSASANFTTTGELLTIGTLRWLACKLHARSTLTVQESTLTVQEKARGARMLLWHV
jgi:hypothetical protein